MLSYPEFTFVLFFFKIKFGSSRYSCPTFILAGLQCFHSESGGAQPPEKPLMREF